MITQINSLEDFYLIKPFLIIEMESYLMNKKEDNKKFNSETKQLIKTSIEQINDIDLKFNIIRQYFITMNEIVESLWNEKIKLDFLFNFFMTENDDFNFSTVLLNIQNEELVHYCNTLYSNFFYLHFFKYDISKEKILNRIKAIVSAKEILNLDDNNELLRNFYIILIRIIEAKKLYLIDKDSTKIIADTFTEIGTYYTLIPYLRDNE